MYTATDIRRIIIDDPLPMVRRIGASLGLGGAPTRTAILRVALRRYVAAPASVQHAMAVVDEPACFDFFLGDVVTRTSEKTESRQAQPVVDLNKPAMFDFLLGDRIETPRSPLCRPVVASASIAPSEPPTTEHAKSEQAAPARKTQQLQGPTGACHRPMSPEAAEFFFLRGLPYPCMPDQRRRYLLSRTAIGRSILDH